MPAREVDRVMAARGIPDADITELTRVIARRSPIRPTQQPRSTATTQQSASTAHHVDVDLVHNSTVNEDPVHTTTSPTHPRRTRQATSGAEDHHESYMPETDLEEDESSDESSDEAAGLYRNVRRKVESGLVEIREDIRQLNDQIQEVHEQMQEMLQQMQEMSQQQTDNGVILSEIKEMVLTLLSRDQATSHRPPSPPRDDPHTD